MTKLSLLLKLLEGETGQLTLGFERVLPDLGQNIRCGNSLIGWDYFGGQIFPDEEEIQRVNPSTGSAPSPTCLQKAASTPSSATRHMEFLCKRLFNYPKT